MPVVTAAIAAVSAAIAVTTVATVATAVVAVATLVGVVGAGLSLIGMATGNKLLGKIGQIMGYVGLAGSVAGGLAGGFSGYGEILQKSWDEGLGSFFSTPAGSGAAAPLQGSTAGIEGGATPAGSGAAADVPAGGVPLTPGANPPPGELAGAPAQGSVGQPSGMLTTSTQAAPVAPAPTAPVAPVAGNQAATDYASAVQESIQSPGTGGLGPSTQANQLATQSAMNSMPTHLVGGVDSMWKSLDPSTKMQLALTGGQGIAGLASGWFTGLSAENRLEYDQMVNAQQQRNASFAPTIGFTPHTGQPAGLLTTGRAA